MLDWYNYIESITHRNHYTRTKGLLRKFNDFEQHVFQLQNAIPLESTEEGNVVTQEK